MTQYPPAPPLGCASVEGTEVSSGLVVVKKEVMEKESIAICFRVVGEAARVVICVKGRGRVERTRALEMLD